MTVKNRNCAGVTRRAFISLLLSVLFVVSCLPGALAVDLTVDAGFYFKQSRSGTCTLASAAMMLRRRAYLDGLSDWTSVTENNVRPAAWANGLSHSFVYHDMQVGYATLPSGTQAKKEMLINLLAQHPEGIVLYDRTQPHAVLLTDYTDGVFYGADPAGNIASGRVPLKNTSVTIERSSCYWYIAADNNAATNSSDELRFENLRYPVNVHVGSGMTLTGLIKAKTDTTLAEVQVAILNESDEIIQSTTVAPEASSWSIKTVDSQIVFGDLTEGTYTYMVKVTDSNGESICFANDFTVSEASTSTSTYWSVQDPDGTMLSDGTSTTKDTALSDIAQGAASWFGSLFG